MIINSKSQRGESRMKNIFVLDWLIKILFEVLIVLYVIAANIVQ